MTTALGVVPLQMLMAISAGAVFMGANTYIGNAPNFMVKSIADENGVRMPSFFGYLLWSLAILIPVFALAVSYTHLKLWNTLVIKNHVLN